MCRQLIDCVTARDPDSLSEREDEYGADGACLDRATAEVCGRECEDVLNQYPAYPECGEGPVTPPPGQPGGLCLAPDGRCDFGSCNRDRNYCFEADDPCLGFRCGGEDRGTCSPDGDQPSCACNAGFENQTFELYCCPEDGGDPDCPG